MKDTACPGKLSGSKEYDRGGEGITNYRKLKNMSVEETAAFLEAIIACCNDENCDGCPLEEVFICDQVNFETWLRKQARE